MKQVEQLKKLEAKKIPEDLDYEKVKACVLRHGRNWNFTDLFPLDRHHEFPVFHRRMFGAALVYMDGQYGYFALSAICQSVFKKKASFAVQALIILSCKNGGFITHHLLKKRCVKTK